MIATTPPQDDSPYDVTLRSFSPRVAAAESVAAPEVSLRRYQSGCWSVIEATGEIDIQVAPRMRNLLNDAPSHVVFDFREVSFMDASGLSVLASAWRAAKSAGGSVRLVCPSERVLKVLTVTQFDRVLPIYDTVGEATR